MDNTNTIVVTTATKEWQAMGLGGVVEGAANKTFAKQICKEASHVGHPKEGA